MKTKFYSFILVFQFLSFYSFTQVVIKNQRTIGGDNYDHLSSMDLTRDGGIVIGGDSYSGISGEKTDNATGGWIVQLNKKGLIQFDTTYNFNEFFKAIQQTNDNGYILGGTSDDGFFNHSQIIKTDNSGKVQWQEFAYGGGGNDENLISIQQITGHSGYVFIADDSYNLFKISIVDSVGTILHQKYIYQFFSPTCFTQTKDGGLIVSGNYSGDYGIIKLDRQGKVTWYKLIGGNGDDKCNAIQQTDNGGYIAGGFSNSNISGDKSENSRGGYDYWLVTLDSAGNIKIDMTIGGADNDYLYALQKTRDGGFIAGGASYSNLSGEKTENSKGSSDYWIVKIKNLKIQWDKTIGGDSYDELNSIKEVKDNDYILGGSSSSGISGDKTDTCRGDFDYWLVEINTKNADNLIAKNSNEKTTSESFIKNGFQVYPNPAKNILHVQTNIPADFSLINDNGKIVLTKNISRTGDITISNLTAGIYYLKNNNTNAIQKISVIK